MAETADILVIGGGMAGVSAAAELSRDVKVIVLEAEESIGYHATGRSAAVFIRNYGNATLRALNDLSAPFLSDPGEVCDGPLLSPRGQMVVACEAEVEPFEAYLSGGEGIEEITAEDAAARFPLLRPERIARAAYEAEAADIDVDRLLQGYARKLRHSGGRIVTGAPAKAIARRAGAWRVEAGGETYETPFLVNAAGAWADEIAAMAGTARMGLVPMRRSAVLVPIDRDVARWPVVVAASESWYAKPDAGKLMISPADEEPVEPHDAWPEDLAIAEGIDRFQRMTTYEVTRVEQSWAGLRTFAPDRTPVVGFAPDAEGFFWLAGQGGYGIQTAPALSRLTARMVLGRSLIDFEDVAELLAPKRWLNS